MIRLINVSKKYKSVTLYQNLNYEFQNGKIYMIKGPNGSGKSVLLKMITGYSKCDSGSIEADGMILRKNVDFLPNAGIFINTPEFQMNKSGMDNLLYLAGIRNIVNEDGIRKYAKMLHIDDQIDEPVRQYSLGMKQKLRIIQAIMDEPDYLIMDEPFDSLDRESSLIVKKIIQLFRDCSRTVIITNHISEYDHAADVICEIDHYTLKTRP